MRRCSLVLTTFFTLLGTGLALQQAGWFRARAARPALSAAPDPATSPAAARWRHSQPGHWRAYIMHP